MDLEVGVPLPELTTVFGSKLAADSKGRDGVRVTRLQLDIPPRLLHRPDCDAFVGGDSAVADIDLAVLNWTIRPAGEQDIEPVLSLWGTAGSAETVTDTRDGVLGLLDADPEALLVAESDDGEIVGSPIAAWDGWRGSFYRLAVHPDRRREGLATALLYEGECRLQARGVARFTAIIADDDPDAMGFWSATGYEQQESRARFVRNVAPSRLGS